MLAFQVTRRIAPTRLWLLCNRLGDSVPPDKHPAPSKGGGELVSMRTSTLLLLTYFKHGTLSLNQTELRFIFFLYFSFLVPKGSLSWFLLFCANG